MCIPFFYLVHPFRMKTCDETFHPAQYNKPNVCTHIHMWNMYPIPNMCTIIHLQKENFSTNIWPLTCNRGGTFQQITYGNQNEVMYLDKWCANIDTFSAVNVFLGFSISFYWLRHQLYDRRIQSICWNSEGLDLRSLIYSTILGNS